MLNVLQRKCVKELRVNASNEIDFLLDCIEISSLQELERDLCSMNMANNEVEINIIVEILKLR